MLAEDVRARVYYEKDGKMLKSPNKVTLKTGWWVVPEDPNGPS